MHYQIINLRRILKMNTEKFTLDLEISEVVIDKADSIAIQAGGVTQTGCCKD